MNYIELSQQIQERATYLCVGLDTDLDKIPKHLHTEPDPQFAFNQAIIDATADYCVAYKINTAFYEAQGAKGWESMEKTIRYIPHHKFIILDAKRGDIGNTVDQYAKAFFERMDVDAITVAPYMGEDSIKPFLKYENKWVILLALTSNPSAQDFQTLRINPEINQKIAGDQNLLDQQGNEYLYERVLKTSQIWGDKSRIMYVVGATQADQLKKIRALVPQHFLLVPGVGAQGGSLAEVSQAGMNEAVGLLVSSSRKIIYASSDRNFAQAAGQAAQAVQEQMKMYLERILG